MSFLTWNTLGYGVAIIAAFEVGHYGLKAVASMVYNLYGKVFKHNAPVQTVTARVTSSTPVANRVSGTAMESLIVARATAVGGFLTGVVGCLDWSPLLGVSGFDRSQLLAVGGIILLIGISSEVSRRMNNGLMQP